MTKSIEEAARDYAEREITIGNPHVTNEREAIIIDFIAGDANGYARAIDEASEEVCNAFYEVCAKRKRESNNR